MSRHEQMGAVHFVGVGGVGMSGLANILLDQGVTVSGSDLETTPATRRLRARGAAVAHGHASENVPEGISLLVRSSAVPDTNPEVAEAFRRGVRVVSRGHFLAEVATCFPCVVAVAGSHGKTTTTAMLAHILKTCGLRPGFLVGGDVHGWPVAASAGGGRILVTEVDESDGTQDAMRSSVALVTNVEDDHCWSVGGEEALLACFAKFARQGQEVLSWDTPKTRELFESLPARRFFDDEAVPPGLQLPVPGQYNRRNATLALAAAVKLGVGEAAALAALESFPGVKRRLTWRYRSHRDTVLLVEDYAHHPTELACLFQALREQCPRHRLLAVFQPHRFERVKRYTAEFAELLSTADEVVVTAPFAAWVADGEAAAPRAIAEGIHGPPAAYWDGEYPDLAEHLMAGALAAASEDEGPEGVLVAVIGAGSVNQLVPPLRASLVRRELQAGARELEACAPALAVSLETPWRELTTLGIGTASPLLVRPKSMEELNAALAVANRRGIEPFVLGRGSNVVGTDAPMRTMVVRLEQGDFARIEIDRNAVVAGAGVTWPALCRALQETERLPPAWAGFASMPGTVGGAVAMNAGAQGTCMADVVRGVEGERFDGTPWSADGEAVEWAYRSGNLPEDVVVSTVRLALPADTDSDAARTGLREGARRRRTTQPSEASAGCAFRNPGDESAGRVIERCGCKGWREGGCIVSRTHANFLVRDAESTEEQFADLMLRVRFAVRRQTGILLHPEVRFANEDTRGWLETCLLPMKVAVLKGGPSAERSVSLRSGAAVAEALRQAGADVVEIDVQTASLPELPTEPDVVFSLIHGTFGEDGALQRLLEQAGLPYVGSDSAASALMMDKFRTKHTLAKHGLRTPQSVSVASPDEPVPNLSFPMIVKPCNQGSSVGMSRLDGPDPEAWRCALEQVFEVDTLALAEEFVDGVDLTVGLLAGEPLPAVEIRPAVGTLYDFDAKYEYKRGRTVYACPPDGVSKAAVDEATELAVQAYRLLGARHLLRVDFRVDPEGRAWILEANTIPGFTETSLLPKSAKQAGISFVELCARLADMAAPATAQGQRCTLSVGS